MSNHDSSTCLSVEPFAMVVRRSRFARPLLLALLLVMLFPALASRAMGQNIQYDDKALDLGLRSTVRVDPVTRGISFEIPLGSYAGRGGLNMPVTLSYTSKVWDVQFQGYAAGPPPPFQGGFQPYTLVSTTFARHSVAGWTSSNGLPFVDFAPSQHVYDMNGFPKTSGNCTQPCYVLDRITIWMPDGSGHEMRATDQPRLVNTVAPDNYYAVDETRMRYQASTGTLFLADGSRYLLNAGQFIDRNGNKLTYSSGAWTDTLGRQIPNPLGVAVGGDQNVSLPGVGGVPVNYVLKWRNLGEVLTTAAPLRYTAESGCPPGQGSYSPNLFSTDYSTRTCIANASAFFNPLVLHQIVLPTGQTYTFTYNVYGEIDKVVLPTGGYEKYTYGQVNGVTTMSSVYMQATRGVYSRIISPSGLGTDEVQWSYTGLSGAVTIVGPAPESKRTEINYWVDSNSNWGYGTNTARAGRIYDERTYNSGGQMLRRKMTDWAMTGSNATGNPSGTLTASRHGRPAREVEFLLDTGGSALAKSTTFTYDTTYQFSVGVEQTDVRAYDFVSVDSTTAQTIAIGSLGSIPNGTQLRRTNTSYLTSNQSYRDRNLLALPTTVNIYNGADVLVSQTISNYDEAAYPLIPVGSPPYTGWTDPATTVRGNVTTTQFWLNTSGTYLQTHAQYDQFGSSRNNWDARQNLTQTDYSPTFVFAYPTTITSADPDGGGPSTALTITTEYDFTTGRTTATIDPNNQRTTFSYNDPLNRIKQVVQAATDAVAKTQATYTYDDINRIVTVTTDRSSFNDNLLKHAKVFDGLGRPFEQRQYENVTDYITIKTEYDLLGRTAKTSNPYRFGEAVVWTTTEYDLFGRVTSVTTPDGAAIRTAYAGDRFLLTEQAGKQRVTRVDALGQVRDVWEIKSADAATEAVSFPGHSEVTAGYRTTYDYDALGNIVKVTQGSQQRYFMFDSLKRLIRMRAPEQGTYAPLNLADSVTGNSAWSNGYQFDANGNLTQRTDPRGVVSVYAYDALNRNTTIDHSDTASINPDVKRFYDGATNGKGRFWYFYKGGDFSAGSNVDHTSIDSYDAVGHPLVQRQLFKLNGVWGPTYQTTRTYNPAGLVTSQTYPSGHLVSYGYDGAGRTSVVTGYLGDGVGRTYANEISYSPFGALSREQFGTTIPLYHKSFYNIRGQLFDTRLSSVNDLWDWNRGRLIFYYSGNHAWGQSGADNNGNVRFAETWIPPENAGLDQTDSLNEQIYNYDALNRLSSVTEQRLSVSNGWVWQTQFQQAYTYDRYGNRTIDVGQTWGINTKQFAADPATNRTGVPVGQPGVMTFDAAGNLINDTYSGSGARTYDADNRMLTAADSANQTSRYTYDADGRRVRKQVASSQERWHIYGFDNELIAEYRASAAASAPEKEYGYRNGQLLVSATGRYNVALASNGAVATASTAHTCCGFSTTGAINGNTHGPWGNGEGWNDATPDSVPDWFQVDFAGSKSIDEIDVFSLHDNYTVENTPTETQTFTLYGLLAFDVQYWNGSAWVTVPGGSVTGNNKVWRKFTFSPVTTSKIRVWINQVPDSWSRLVEVEAYGTSAGGEKVQWIVTDHLGTSRMIADQTGSLAGVKRHDYMPFGEELFAGTGGRITAHGYSGSDGVRQQFTGYERDAETTLDYALTRYYNWQQGRFTSPDSYNIVFEKEKGRDDEEKQRFFYAFVLQPQSWNKYVYCLNNPLKFTDPDGRRELTDEDKRRLQRLWDLAEAVKNSDPDLYNAINEAIVQIAAAIDAVPEGQADPASLTAVFWAIDNIGNTNYGKMGTAGNGYTVETKSGDWKCNIFVANAYAIGAGVGWDKQGGVPTNSSFLGGIAGRRWPTDANTLANGSATVQSFIVVSSPEIGDLAAFPNPVGLGHSAIFAGGSSGRGLLIYAGLNDVKVNTVNKTQAGVAATSVTFRRYKP
jgi:RHS repeat-associated protein